MSLGTVSRTQKYLTLDVCPLCLTMLLPFCFSSSMVRNLALARFSRLFFLSHHLHPIDTGPCIMELALSTSQVEGRAYACLLGGGLHDVRLTQECDGMFGDKLRREDQLLSLQNTQENEKLGKNLFVCGECALIQRRHAPSLPVGANSLLWSFPLSA